MAEAAAGIPAPEKYAIALQYKQDGNAAFKTKNLKLAIRSYHKALLYIRGLDQHAVKLPQMLATDEQRRDREQRQLELTGELTELVDQLKVDTYNNLAACLVQSEHGFNLKKVLEYCDEVMELSPTNRKCWFRRGQAYCRAGDYQQAEHSLLKARQLEADTDPAIERLLSSCREHLRREYQANKALYQGMFSNSTS